MDVTDGGIGKSAEERAALEQTLLAMFGAMISLRGNLIEARAALSALMEGDAQEAQKAAKLMFEYDENDSFKSAFEKLQIWLKLRHE